MLTWLIPSIWNYKEVSELPNFQQSVNRALSTAGVLAGLSGIPQRKAAQATLQLPADEGKQSSAMDRMSRQQEAMKKQRRNFMSYLAQQSTSFGGTVGDLPKPVQKQIASQYSKSQRKTMMDRMDKEAKNGKQ